MCAALPVATRTLRLLAPPCGPPALRAVAKPRASLLTARPFASRFASCACQWLPGTKGPLAKLGFRISRPDKGKNKEERASLTLPPGNQRAMKEIDMMVRKANEEAASEEAAAAAGPSKQNTLHSTKL